MLDIALVLRGVQKQMASIYIQLKTMAITQITKALLENKGDATGL